MHGSVFWLKQNWPDIQVDLTSTSGLLFLYPCLFGNKKKATHPMVTLHNDVNQGIMLLHEFLVPSPHPVINPLINSDSSEMGPREAITRKCLNP